jgi:hypothetical protein
MFSACIYLQLLCLLTDFCLEVLFVKYEYRYCLLLDSICLEYHFIFFHFHSVLVSTSEMCFLQADSSWILFLSVQSTNLCFLVGE